MFPVEVVFVEIKMNPSDTRREHTGRYASCVEIGRFVFDLFEEKLLKLAQVFNAYSKKD